MDYKEFLLLKDSDARLRRKLGNDVIRTVHGVGYRFADEREAGT